jgi:lipoyl(octanoyl) transferase
VLATPIIKRLGQVAFEPTWRAMQAANKARTPESPDEIWLLEHPPVFTLGLAGKPEHVLAPGNIEVIKIDRGGQVTYHGPGQLVVYLMLDLRRAGFGVKEMVRRIEQSVIDLLLDYGIEGRRLNGMPGVYVNAPSPSVPPPRGGREENLAPLPSWETREHLKRSRGWGEGEARTGTNAKIAAIGLRVANHATYHGLSLNIDMDLEPFSRINPCGYEGLAVTQMKDCGVDFGKRDKMQVIGNKLLQHLSQQLYGKHHG